MGCGAQQKRTRIRSNAHVTIHAIVIHICILFIMIMIAIHGLSITMAFSAVFLVSRRQRNYTAVAHSRRLYGDEDRQVDRNMRPHQD